MSKSVRKILIIRYSSMGDVILVAPLIGCLNARYPDAEISLLTHQPYGILYKNDSRLNRVFTVSKGESCSEPEIMEHWDLVVDLQNNRRSHQQILLLKAGSVKHFSKLHKERNLLLFLRINRYPKEYSIAERYIAAAGESVSGLVPDYRLSINAGDHGEFAKILQHGEIKRPVVAMFPFSAWKNKQWPEASFVSVGHFFLIKGWNVVILGGKQDRLHAARMADKIGYRCVSMAGMLDLYECGALLKQCSLALGCDTGLSHLARACGIKCGFIFGPTTHHFGFQPIGDPDCRVFESSHYCRPCHPHGGNICLRFDHACMKSISPDEVISGLLELCHG